RPRQCKPRRARATWRSIRGRNGSFCRCRTAGLRRHRPHRSRIRAVHSSLGRFGFSSLADETAGRSKGRFALLGADGKEKWHVTMLRCSAAYLLATAIGALSIDAATGQAPTSAELRAQTPSNTSTDIVAYCADLKRVAALAAANDRFASITGNPR